MELEATAMRDLFAGSASHVPGSIPMEFGYSVHLTDSEVLSLPGFTAEVRSRSLSGEGLTHFQNSVLRSHHLAQGLYHTLNLPTGIPGIHYLIVQLRGQPTSTEKTGADSSFVVMRVPTRQSITVPEYYALFWPRIEHLLSTILNSGGMAQLDGTQSYSLVYSIVLEKHGPVLFENTMEHIRNWLESTLNLDQTLVWRLSTDATTFVNGFSRLLHGFSCAARVIVSVFAYLQRSYLSLYQGRDLETELLSLFGNKLLGNPDLKHRLDHFLLPDSGRVDPEIRSNLLANLSLIDPSYSSWTTAPSMIDIASEFRVSSAGNPYSWVQSTGSLQADLQDTLSALRELEAARAARAAENTGPTVSHKRHASEISPDCLEPPERMCKIDRTAHEFL